MPEMVENKMVVDWWWGEIEYGVPDKTENLEEVDEDDDE